MKKILLCCVAMIFMYQLRAQVAHYDFNGTMNDVTPNALNGTPNFVPGSGTYVSGSPTTGSQALHLNNGQYVMVPYDSRLDLYTWTISAIVRLTSYNGSDNRILERFDTVGGRWSTDFMSTEVYNTNFYGYAAYGSPNFTGLTPAVVNTGQWVCLTATYDGNNLKTYVNGVLAYNMPWISAYSFGSKTPTMYIGSKDPNYGMIGDIDDIQIFSGVLTPGQVLTACNNFPPPSSASCNDSCYWKVTGNSIINGNNIFGTRTVHDVEIRTSNTPRGRLTLDGNFDWGSNGFNNGAATNMAVGNSNTTNNVANNSLCVGLGNTLTNVLPIGPNPASSSSVVAGHHNLIENADQAFVFGEANTSRKTEISHFFGNLNTISNSTVAHAGGGRNFIDSSYYVYAEGYANKITKSNVSQAFGDSNSVSGSKSVFSIGDSNHVVNSLTIVTQGYNNNITGSSYSMANGKGNSITSGTGIFIGGNINRSLPGTNPNNANTLFGQDNTIANSQTSGVIGSGNTITTASASFATGAGNNVNGSNSMAIGKNNYIQGNDIHLYGEGLTNNSPNSISIGMQGRAITVTNRGVAIQMQPGSGSVWTPIHNLDVEAAPVAGVLSNIAFHHLPDTNVNFPLMVIDTTTGEIFRVPNTVQNFASNQGISQTGNVFRLGDSCGAVTLNPFTTNRTIHIRNNNLYFNTLDNGRLFMGSSTCQPLATRLEISGSGLTGAGNSYATGSPSFSGLRFSVLTHQSTPIPAQATANGKYGVLSLDNEGDVIWVEDQSGGSSSAANGCSLNGSTVELGEACTNRTGNANLNGDRVVPLNDNNLVFETGSFTQNNQGAGKNRVGIGTTCAPAAKLEVIRNAEPNPYDADNRAIAGVNLDAAAPAGPNGLGAASGVYGEANNLQNPLNLGGDFKGVSGHMETYGVRGRGDGMNASNAVYGGWFSACGALGTDPTGSTTYNIGVYGEVCNKRGWAGYFNGITYCTAGVWTSSDSRIKKNIEPISNALGIIDQLQPKKYQYNTAVYPGLNLPEDVDNYGVIAQDLEKVLPALVKTTPVPGADGKGLSKETIKTVNYTELIPILIQAVKEQQQTINTLKAENEAYKKTIEERLNQLQQSINNICENGCGGTSTKATDGAAAKDQLYQSVPNPADSKTMISYTLVRNYENAQIVISDMNGRMVQTISIQAKAGNGNVTVDLGTFAAQQYIYSLYVNGQSVDSKKMMVVR